MKRVACIAECCCDLIFAGLPRTPALGEEVYGNVFVRKAGGGANTALSLARLGVPTAMVTRVGDDDMGRFVLSELESALVRVSGRLREPGSRTAVSAVLSTGTDRCFASFADAAEPCFEGAALEQAVQESDIVHTYLGYCTHFPIPALCERYGRVLSLDVSWADTQDAAGAAEVLQRTDWLKLNKEEAMRLTGCGEPEEALERLSRLVKRAVVVTLGSGGSIGMEHGSGRVLRCESVRCGAFRDACGAGDNYAAGLLRGLAAGLPLAQAMRLGAETAGQAVTWYGGNDPSLKIP